MTSNAFISVLFTLWCAFANAREAQVLTDSISTCINCMGPESQSKAIEDVLSAVGPKKDKPVGTPITLTATQYYTPIVSTTANGYSALNNGKHPKLSEKDFCISALQGSFSTKIKGVITTYTVASSKRSSLGAPKCSKYISGGDRFGKFTFFKTTHPYGSGNRSNPLIPFRTLAVGSTLASKLPFGTIVYIKEAVGVKITRPDGTEYSHDGYFIVGDRGALRQNQVDVFIGPVTGTKSPPHVFSFTNSSSRKSHPFEAQIVDDSKIRAKLKEEERTMLAAAKGSTATG